MDNDKLDDLRVLLATADTGSLTAAAQRCDISKAAVSAAIRRLEGTLGARLFERTTRSVRPTSEGDVMIAHARQALAIIAEGQACVRSGTLGLSGTIRLSATTTLSQYALGTWLGSFSARHPGLEIDLQVSDAVVDLVREGVDVALRNGPLGDSTLVARMLAPARRFAAASPDYLARRGQPRHPAELVHHDCITYVARGRRLSEWHFEALPGHAAEPPGTVSVNGCLLCNSAAVAQQWAVQGLGVVYLSELDALEALQRGELVRLFPHHLGEPVPLYAVMASKRFRPARVQILVEELGRYLADRLQQVAAHAVATAACAPSGAACV